MLRNLRKLFGVSQDESGAEPALPVPPRSPRAQAIVTHNVIGQTLVATIVERELNSATAADACWEIKDLYARQSGVRHVILDLENIRYMDSAGLNGMVDLLATVKRRHGRIGIVAATQQVEVLFKLTRLELVFTIRRTVIEAIDAIEPKG